MARKLSRLALEQLQNSLKEEAAIARGAVAPSTVREPKDAMTVADFHIGMEFMFGWMRYRVTDVGTRTFLAIRVDHVPTGVTGEGELIYTTVTQAEVEAKAEYAGYFYGPPYSVPEVIFDEGDLCACEPLPESPLPGKD